MAGIPPARDTDAEDVSWALQTAETQWKRNERADALIWLRRATQAAADANDDDRALELARCAAELAESLAASPPPAPVPLQVAPPPLPHPGAPPPLPPLAPSAPPAPVESIPPMSVSIDDVDVMMSMPPASINDADIQSLPPSGPPEGARPAPPAIPRAPAVPQTIPPRSSQRFPVPPQFLKQIGGSDPNLSARDDGEDDDHEDTATDLDRDAIGKAAAQREHGSDAARAPGPMRPLMPTPIADVPRVIRVARKPAFEPPEPPPLVDLPTPTPPPSGRSTIPPERATPTPPPLAAPRLPSLTSSATYGSPYAPNDATEIGMRDPSLDAPEDGLTQQRNLSPRDLASVAEELRRQQERMREDDDDGGLTEQRKMSTAEHAAVVAARHRAADPYANDDDDDGGHTERRQVEPAPSVGVDVGPRAERSAPQKGEPSRIDPSPAGHERELGAMRRSEPTRPDLPPRAAPLAEAARASTGPLPHERVTVSFRKPERPPPIPPADAPAQAEARDRVDSETGEPTATAASATTAEAQAPRAEAPASSPSVAPARAERPSIPPRIEPPRPAGDPSKGPPRPGPPRPDPGARPTVRLPKAGGLAPLLTPGSAAGARAQAPAPSGPAAGGPATAATAATAHVAQAPQAGAASARARTASEPDGAAIGARAAQLGKRQVPPPPPTEPGLPEEPEIVVETSPEAPAVAATPIVDAPAIVHEPAIVDEPPTEADAPAIAEAPAAAPAPRETASDDAPSATPPDEPPPAALATVSHEDDVTAQPAPVEPIAARVPSDRPKRSDASTKQLYALAESTAEALLADIPHPAISEPHTPVHASQPPQVAADAILVLDDVEAFADLPEDARETFAKAAKIARVTAGEEVSGFALAYVVAGDLDVAATIVDATATRLLQGGVLRARGTPTECVPLRLVCTTQEAVVAVWSDGAVEEAFRSCPWVEDDLRAASDQVQTLAGVTMGALGDRIDGALRDLVTSRLTVRSLLEGELIVEAGSPVPGIVVVGVGKLELVDKDVVVGEVRSGDFLFPAQVLGSGPAPYGARAGEGGALVMAGDRKLAQELLVTVPPLLEIFAGM